MTLKVWTYGETPLASADLNGLPQIVSIQNPGSGVESSLISASSLSGAGYLKFTFTMHGSATGSSDYGRAAFKLETKDNGGSYATDYNQTAIENVKGSNFSTTVGVAQSIVITHALTANELANGLYFKYTVTVTSASGGSASLTIDSVTVEKYRGV